MRFIKGKSGNINGRPKGAKNKDKAVVESLSYYLCTGGLLKFENALNSLNKKDYINAMLKLIQITVGTTNKTHLIADEKIIQLTKNLLKDADRSK